MGKRHIYSGPLNNKGLNSAGPRICQIGTRVPRDPWLAESADVELQRHGPTFKFCLAFQLCGGWAPLPLCCSGISYRWHASVVAYTVRCRPSSCTHRPGSLAMSQHSRSHTKLTNLRGSGFLSLPYFIFLSEFSFWETEQVYLLKMRANAFYNI